MFTKSFTLGENSSPSSPPSLSTSANSSHTPQHGWEQQTHWLPSWAASAATPRVNGLSVRQPPPQKTQACLDYFHKPKGYIYINELDMCAYFTQIYIFCPRMPPLAHIIPRVNNISAIVWSKPGSIIASTTSSTLLRKISLLSRHFHIHASIQNIAYRLPLQQPIIMKQQKQIPNC